MSEISMYEAQKKKMEGLCEEHDLTYRFQKDTYPPTFTISPIQDMGAMVLDALSGSDVPVVMLSTMVIAAVTLAASCLVDILTAALDPRVRLN